MNETNYDIFISFKDNFDGNRTWASEKGEHIFQSLRARGYNPFYSRVTMNERLSEGVSDSINFALDSAKVMILVFSSPREVNAKWVKYEWGKFMHMNKPIITVFRDMNSEDWEKIQPELADIQAINLSIEKIDLTDEVGINMYDVVQ